VKVREPPANDYRHVAQERLFLQYAGPRDDFTIHHRFGASAVVCWLTTGSADTQDAAVAPVTRGRNAF
jgi:hypothetical protein